MIMTSNHTCLGLLGETLMWVGRRDCPGLETVFRFCVEHAPQLAWRANVRDALHRASENVRCLVIARPNRAPVDISALTELVAGHQHSNVFQLIGPLGAGIPNIDPRCLKLPWYDGSRVLSRVLNPPARKTLPMHSAGRSVAVVAQSAAVADPLMELAASCAASAFWCRQPAAFQLRNVDVVWWDDSVATATDPARWRARLESMEQSCGRNATHVWLTSLLQKSTVQAAHAAGVHVVLSKPSRIEDLMATLEIDDCQRDRGHSVVKQAA